LKAREADVENEETQRLKALVANLSMSNRVRRRGPKTAWSDGALRGKIREVIAASPFYSEGHRKVWAGLRF
jgi:hypothetical protein